MNKHEDIPEIREYEIKFEIPIYRQCKKDLELYLKSVISARNRSGKKATLDNIEEFFDAKQVAEDKCYKDDRGFYIPTKQIKGALINAAKRFKDPQRGQTATQRVKAGIKMAAEKIYLPHSCYTIFTDLVEGPRGLIPTAWPEFRDLTIAVPVQLLDEFISLEFLRNLAQVAITMFGIGSGRPECGTGKLIEITKL